MLPTQSDLIFPVEFLSHIRTSNANVARMQDCVTPRYDKKKEKKKKKKERRKESSRRAKTAEIRTAESQSASARFLADRGKTRISAG